MYPRVGSSNASRLEAHAVFFRLLMNGIFYPFVLWHSDKKMISLLVTRISIQQFAFFDQCLTDLNLSHLVLVL